jgi:hypothetical protein
MSAITKSFSELVTLQNPDANVYSKLIDDIFKDNVTLNISDKSYINCCIHSILLRQHRTNNSKEILQPFDCLYAGLTELKDRVSNESRADCVWLYLTPFIRDIRESVGSMNVQNRIIYSNVANNLMFKTNLNLSDIGECSYVFISSHNTACGLYAYSRKVGKTIVNLVHQGYGGENSYSVVPEWGPTSKHTVKMPGMAYGIKPFKLDTVKANLAHIVLPYTGNKFNNKSLKFIKDLSNKLGEAPYEATLLLGDRDENISVPVIKMFLGKLGKRWKVVINNNEEYNKLMGSATVVVGSYPCDDFDTAMTSVSCGKPFVTQYGAGDSVYEFMKMFNLEQGCFKTSERLISEITRYVEDEDHVSEKNTEFEVAQKNIEEICIIHNENIQVRFGEFIDKFGK